MKQKPIHKIKAVSKKQAKNISEYSQEKGPWIEGRVCEVCKSCYADQIHHRKGRLGFSDLWARLKNITLLMDKRFWLAVCGECHTRITANSKWAAENGYSLPRRESLN